MLPPAAINSAGLLRPSRMRAFCRVLPRFLPFAFLRHPILRPFAQRQMSTCPPPLRIALLQIPVTLRKDENLRVAADYISRAAASGARLVALPECFNSPYGTQHFASYAEAVAEGQPSYDALSKAAKDNSVWLFGGSIPERSDEGNLYNTCMVFAPSGRLVGTYRKMHLFDISIPGGITFQESSTLSPGSAPLIVDVEGVKVGVGICFDLRFPRLAELYASRRCSLLLYPGAFNMTTGPLHWELLVRSRALDSQLWVAAVCCARDATAGYVAYGHSMLVGPMGNVVEQAQEHAAIVEGVVNVQQCVEVRQNIPVIAKLRPDVYGSPQQE